MLKKIRTFSLKRPLIRVLVFYKKYISGFLTSLFGGGCRFTPTCSEYTIGAVERHGTLRGLGLGFKRVLRCHPWGGEGFDPVPEPNSKQSQDV